MNKQYYVYIMTNKFNTTLYTGITSNLIRRVWEHKQKFVKGFTKKYNINKLVYFEIFDDPENAITKEKAIKNLVRRKKDQLINASNPEWKELYQEILSG
ncbi:MAG: excinuclease ABC subunit C [Candidatus Levybacteria bacterium RIFCSPHIGHO2_01_FULL_36_15]|nr:MAG: excinuclease ABC subunit C [Candidatus Levybacteria bacterium RIFCSPHIGHO2_01_FULL_36_15]